MVLMNGSAARARGMKLAYSAAPFDAAITARLLPETDLLVVNKIEAAALSDMLGAPAKEAGIPHLVAHAAAVARTITASPAASTPAFSVTPVDTTGAGDCFGYLLAAMAATGRWSRRWPRPPPPPPSRSRGRCECRHTGSRRNERRVAANHGRIHQMAQKIIIDTDPGIDDAMAIHMTFADLRPDVVGLTTVFGNDRQAGDPQRAVPGRWRIIQRRQVARRSR